MPLSLFGTDGVRGRPGLPPLDEPTLLRLGAAVVQTCGKKKGSVRVLIGQDSRESGEPLPQVGFILTDSISLSTVS